MRHRSCGSCNARVDFVAKHHKVYRLGKKPLSAALQSLALRFGVAVCSDHDHRNVGSRRLGFRQQFEPCHSRHVDVRQDQYQRRGPGIGYALQGFESRLGKLHGEAAHAKVAPELLAKQQFDVGFVIDHENKDAHARAPDLPREAAVRGRVILNSVNSPGCVSTSIDPACCLTMISWLMERPSPVPSPAGFVVKNGLNILSFTSGGMPVPLSRMRISTRSPRFLVAAARVGSKPLSPPWSLRFVAA